LRWFEPAWPARLAVFNKMLLLDAGIYGFLVIRRLQHVGFDLRLRLADLRIGARELTFYAPIAIALGLALGFLHFHAYIPSVSQVLLAWLFTFFFIAVPEELFFRAGYRIFWSVALARAGRWLLRLCSSGYLTSTNAPFISTGAMSCLHC
jgi:hypothetical protein